MIDALKERMTANNFSQFQKDYALLYDLKEDSALWRSAMCAKCGRVPLLKKIFDSLSNPYSYIEYTNKIKANTLIFHIVMGLNKDERNNEQIRLCLEFHYTTETYIGFIVETVLYDILKDHTKHIHKNNTLDIVKKTDLLFKGYHFQIKNNSFLLSAYLLEMLENYAKANPQLFFIFYTIEKDNINFLQICGSPYIHIKKIDCATFAKPIRSIPLSECINTLLSL